MVSCVPESVSWPDERGLCNCVITGLALRYVLYKSSFVAFLSQKKLICFEDEADSKVGDTFSCVVLDDKSWINQEKEKGQTFQHSLRLSPWDNLGISSQPNLQGKRKSEAQTAVGRMVRRAPCCLLEFCPPWWQSYQDHPALLFPSCSLIKTVISCISFLLFSLMI